MAGGSTGQSRQRLFLLTGTLLVCLAAIWYFARGGSEPAAPAPVAQEEPEPAAAGAPPVAPRPAPAPAPAPPPAPGAADEVITSDGIPIAPPRGEVIGPHHPHPITPQHLRLFGENRLMGALDGAMEIKDTAGMRRLLEQYRREYPEDDQESQDGYAIIADCIDHPGAAGGRAAADRWLDSHNGSTVKRFVVRYCLEPQQP